MDSITIIGSGTAVPSPKRGSPCTLVSLDGRHILLDTGPGSIRQLSRIDIAPPDIALVIYSHFHVDHINDLPALLFAAKYSPDCSRSEDLPIMGPAGLTDLYAHLRAAYGHWLEPDAFAIVWIEAVTACQPLPGLTVTTAPVAHTDQSMAVKLQHKSGKSIVYSGDTEYCDTLVELARNADILICECAFPDHLPSPGHLTPSTVGRIAHEASCASVVATHFYPPCDAEDIAGQIGRHYSGRIIVAEDLMRIRL